jgi:RpiR family carbohydrate utilization transcriptional regulator
MLSRIQRQAETLSKSERRVAEWVLQHPRQAAEASVASVARAAGTSDPTVIRFCRHLGLSGFREMKLRLAEALSRPTRYVHSDVNADDSTADVVTKVIDRSIQALFDARSTVASIPLDDAIAAMASSRQIVFCGVGASGHIAGDASHKFFRLGIPCTAVSDVATMLQLAAVADRADVYVIISQSGATLGPVAVSEALRKRGIRTIAVTASGSALAARAGTVVDCQPDEDTSIVTPMSSRLAKLAVLDAMQVALALKLGAPAGQRLHDSKQALEILRAPEDI